MVVPLWVAAQCTWGGWVAHQADGLAGDAEPDGHLRAQRHEVEVLCQGATAQPRFLVPSVEAHGVAEQARADPQFGALWQIEGHEHGTATWT
ncbi:hypothetical protein D9M68_1005230 [compost metagenome]